jgi:hypothetical protein
MEAADCLSRPPRPVTYGPTEAALASSVIIYSQIGLGSGRVMSPYPDISGLILGWAHPLWTIAGSSA